MGHNFLKKSRLGILIAVLLGFAVWQWNEIQDSRLRDEKRQEKPLQSQEIITKQEKNREQEENKEQEGNKEQEENKKREFHKSHEESVEGLSHIEAEPVLDLANIQVMKAGAVLDISKMEQGMIDSLFYSEEIGDEVQNRILGVSYLENDNISLQELRYLRVLHMGFDGQTHIGELLVNVSIAEDILEIMAELYKNSYPIEKMLLIDEYDADDELSMSDNNTSAFNYREIAGTSRMSRHSLGAAIDINPLFNPYVKENGDGDIKISPANGAGYADRSQEFEYKIDENDLCYKLFMEHGFSWGGNWNSLKDYQHFEK